MTLLIGFDSAWSPKNSGAIAAVLRRDDGTLQEFESPRPATYSETEDIVLCWQKQFAPASTVILLDHPTIVTNPQGQRPVEGIVSSPVSARLGGMQPASFSRAEMFGPEAPVWSFLQRFGGPADPASPSGGALVFETYPVLVLIALGWTLPDTRITGRLPKYNPQRTRTFAIEDWRHVCSLTAEAFRSRGMTTMSRWLEQSPEKHAPRKSDQDCLDACLGLLVALHTAEGGDYLMTGDIETGYIVPDSPALFSELEARCRCIGRNPADCVRTFRQKKTIIRKSTVQATLRETHVPKPYHSMTPAERIADRIAKNRAREQTTSGKSVTGWSLPSRRKRNRHLVTTLSSRTGSSVQSMGASIATVLRQPESVLRKSTSRHRDSPARPREAKHNHRCSILS